MPLSNLWSPYLYNSYTTPIPPFTPMPLSNLWSPYLWNSYTTQIPPFTPMPLSNLWSPYLYNSYTTPIQPFTPMPLSNLWSPYLYNSYTTPIPPFTPCPCLISDHHTCTTAMPTVMDATTMRLFSIHFCPEGIQPAVYILVSLSKSYKTKW